MKPEQWFEFKDAVAADIQGQYPKVDYLLSTVYNAIERHKRLLEDTPPQEQVFKTATHEPVTVGGRVAWVEKPQEQVCESGDEINPSPLRGTNRETLVKVHQAVELGKQRPVVCEWVRLDGIGYECPCNKRLYFDQIARCPICLLPVKVKGGGE
jgi:hypothetical protein